MRYIIDSNIFIQAKNRDYPFEFFPGIWEWFDQKIVSHDFLLLKPVYDELSSGNDSLADWVTQRRSYVTDLNEDCYRQIGIIAEHVRTTYPDPKCWPGFLDVADAKLIAYAAANQSVIVTNELAKISCKKPKIPAVSAAVGIKCLSLLELFQATQPRFILQNGVAI